MPKEIGPRERQLREQREAAYETNQARMKAAAKTDKAAQREKLDALVAAASTKTGKSRKPTRRTTK